MTRPGLRLEVLELSERARVGIPFVSEETDPNAPESVPVCELEIPNPHHGHTGGQHAEDHAGPRLRRILSP